MDKQKFLISKKLHWDRYVFSIAANLFLWGKKNVKFSGRDQEKNTWNLQGSWFALKACVRYFFLKKIIFHQMIVLQKLWKMFLISSKKLFSLSSCSNFFCSNFHLPLFFSQLTIALQLDPRQILKFMTSSIVQIRT